MWLRDSVVVRGIVQRFNAHVSGIAQQLGLATMPSCSARVPPFTSGTTAGCRPPSGTRRTCRSRTAPPATAWARARGSWLCRPITDEVEIAGLQRIGSCLLDNEVAQTPTGRARRCERTHVRVSAAHAEATSDRAHARFARRRRHGGVRHPHSPHRRGGRRRAAASTARSTSSWSTWQAVVIGGCS